MLAQEIGSKDKENRNLILESAVQGYRGKQLREEMNGQPDAGYPGESLSTDRTPRSLVDLRPQLYNAVVQQKVSGPSRSACGSQDTSLSPYPASARPSRQSS